MYITNRPEIACIVEQAGVDRIFVDLEYIGKVQRQGGMDTVQSQHTLEDVKRVSESLTTAELLVRVNPIHEADESYTSSEDEIDAAIANGADILMLPYFKTAAEVKRFIDAVSGRVQTMLLLETPEAVDILDDILAIPGIDSIHIGLNDLSLGYKRNFMFEILADGTVERICKKIKAAKIPYGFGGIAALGKGTVPAEYVIREHYRLGSDYAILSRSFCNTEKVQDLTEIQKIFTEGLREIRELEQECISAGSSYFEENRQVFRQLVYQFVESRRAGE